MKPGRILSIPLLLLVLALPAPTAAGPKDALVKIYTVYNRYDYHEPWQMQGQQSSQGSGCIIAGRRVLTNAHVVSDRTFIQVRRAGQARKFTAEVETVAHDCDLALLRVADPRFWEGGTPLSIGELPQVKDPVAVYGFPEGGDKLSITEGVVSRVEHRNYTHSGTYLLAGQIDAPINSGSSGGPVLRGAAIAGVAFQGLKGDRRDSIGYLVPAPLIRRFLQDITDGRYHGIPGLGLSMQKMENPALHRYYGLGEEQTGVLIVKTYPQSPAAGLLQPGDILLAVDGANIADDGTIEFRAGERTFLGNTVQMKQMGDTVRLAVLRDGRRRDVTLTLDRSAAVERLVPHNRYDVAPTYYIFGGLVFEPLSLNYLKAFGREGDWFVRAPTELLDLFYNGEPAPGREEVVLLAKVLADEINVGYHGFVNGVVARVNGRRIGSTAELAAAFEEYTGRYHTIEDIRGYRLVLDGREVAAAGERILTRYRIGSDRSADLR